MWRIHCTLSDVYLLHINSVALRCVSLWVLMRMWQSWVLMRMWQSCGWANVSVWCWIVWVWQSWSCFWQSWSWVWQYCSSVAVHGNPAAGAKCPASPVNHGRDITNDYHQPPLSFLLWQPPISILILQPATSYCACPDSSTQNSGVWIPRSTNALSTILNSAPAYVHHPCNTHESPM